MSEAIKPTPGPWHVANGVQIRGEREQIAKVWMMRRGEGKANALLIAEAGTVRGETGLTPRQLAALNGELVEALRAAQQCINSMKVEAETAAQGDEQMMLEACETISNEGLQADMAIRRAIVRAAAAIGESMP